MSSCDRAVVGSRRCRALPQVWCCAVTVQLYLSISRVFQTKRAWAVMGARSCRLLVASLWPDETSAIGKVGRQAVLGVTRRLRIACRNGRDAEMESLVRPTVKATPSPATTEKDPDSLYTCMNDAPSHLPSLAPCKDRCGEGKEGEQLSCARLSTNILSVHFHVRSIDVAQERRCWSQQEVSSSGGVMYGGQGTAML